MSNAAARPPRLIVGPGNPGRRMLETRHNAGFGFREAVADQLGAPTRSSRVSMAWWPTRVKLACGLMPQTFMNRAPAAIGALARFYRIEPAEILVVHDEPDIPPPGWAQVPAVAASAATTALRHSPPTGSAPTTTGACASASAIRATATRW